MSATTDFDQQFREVLEDVLGWDVEIRDEDGPGTVEGWDSLSHVRLVHALETRFDVRLPDDALLGEQTAASLRQLVQDRLGPG
jgi:acyl carrier protein